MVDTVADPDYVTASASRERLELANEAGSLDLALDAADTIQGQDSLEKMLVHQMAVLHRGMMKAATRMNEELIPRRVWKKAGGKQPTCGLADLPEQYHACQPGISRACSRYSASEPGETSTSL